VGLSFRAAYDGLKWFARVYWREFAAQLPFWQGVSDLEIAAQLFIRWGLVLDVGTCRVGFALTVRDRRGATVVRSLARSGARAERPQPDLTFDQRAAPWPRFIPDSWYASGVFVAPEHRRLGYARLLAQHRLTQADDAGARCVFVACVEDSGTEELYEGLGFLEVDRIDSLVLMARPAGPPVSESFRVTLSMPERLRSLWLRAPWTTFAVLTVAGLAVFWASSSSG